jgi:transposase
MQAAKSANLNRIKMLRELKKKLSKNKAPAYIIIRIKILIAYYKGIASDKITQCFDITKRTLKRVVKQYEADGTVEDRPRSGRPVRLPPEQAAELKKMITEQKKRVWTARHVYVLLASTFSIMYSVKYLPEVLKSLGLSFHKAVHFLIRRNSEARREWIQTKLPELYKKLAKEGWRIFFQDEVGFQTEGTLAHTWGEKGAKIEVENYGRHGRINLIGAVELGTGVFYGVMTKFKVTATRFRRFLCHLKWETRTDKILVICDNASFHKAKWLREWMTQQTGWLRLEFLPPYSPDLNPIERLWHWWKQEFTHNKCWDSQAALRKCLAQSLTDLPKHTAAILGIMRKELDRLKMAFDLYETPFPFQEAESTLGKNLCPQTTVGLS